MTVRAAGSDVRMLPSPMEILDQQPNAVVAADRDGNLVYANAYATALFGLPDHPSHLVGRVTVVLPTLRASPTLSSRWCTAGPGRARWR
jgi:PAS domain-containing protein